MRSLRDLRSPRALALPIAVYVLIALALPIVNGAASRPDFARHTATVVVGVSVLFGAILAGELALRRIDIAIAALRRIANNRAARRVSSGGSR